MSRTTKDQEQIDAITAILVEARKAWINLAEAVWSSGYRLDHMPNGKDKSELIEIIGAKQWDLDRARVLLRTEHEQRIKETFAISMERHRELRPDCTVCKFLEETSTVKS